jgi:Transposase DDE domain
MLCQTLKTAGRRLSESRMRENLMSGSMWQGMGNLDMAMVLRHSQKKWRETGLPCLRFWHHPLTLPCVEFLKEDGTPRYKRPIWLFWTGPEDVTLQDLCRMYLWRFAIEHLFRFLKQHMGLNSNRSTSLASTEKWMWLCVLAYWQLLLMRHLVQPNRPAWHRRHKNGLVHSLTPAQVQRSALAFLLQSGTPARNTRPAGKGYGRQKGFQPAPRSRYDVVFKTKKTHKQPATR